MAPNKEGIMDLEEQTIAERDEYHDWAMCKQDGAVRMERRLIRAA